MQADHATTVGCFVAFLLHCRFSRPPNSSCQTISLGVPPPQEVNVLQAKRCEELRAMVNEWRGKANDADVLAKNAQAKSVEVTADLAVFFGDGVDVVEHSRRSLRLQVRFRLPAPRTLFVAQGGFRPPRGQAVNSVVAC